MKSMGYERPAEHPAPAITPIPGAEGLPFITTSETAPIISDNLLLLPFGKKLASLNFYA